MTLDDPVSAEAPVSVEAAASVEKSIDDCLKVIKNKCSNALNGKKTVPELQKVLKDTLGTIFDAFEAIEKKLQLSVEPPQNDLLERVDRLEAGAKSARKQEAKIEWLERELDETRQRSLKGNFILSSPNLDNRPSIILTKDELTDADIDIKDHVVNLIKENYDREIAKEDIRACHRVGKFGTGIVIRFCDRSAGSSWAKLTEKGRVIKRVKKDANIFLNFQLTKHRSEMSAES